MKEGIIIRRPILVAVLGYIIGIIMGLYFKISIVSFYIPIAVIYIIKKKYFLNDKTKKQSKKLKILNYKRYIRYLKLFVNSKVISCFMIFSIISNSIIIFQNARYDNLYKNMEIVKGEGIVISYKEEREYDDVYKIKIKNIDNKSKYKNTCLYLKIPKKKKIELNYGDKIEFKGEFLEPTLSRNKGGFNYKNYLKTKKIYGSVKLEVIQIKSKIKSSSILRLFNEINIKIKKNIDSTMDKETASIIKGILLGDKKGIEENTQEDFKVANLSHILAVSGMHVAYLILGIEIIFKNIVGKRNNRIITILILIFYVGIVGFSSSLVRAAIMGILAIGALLVHRRNDIATSISISLLIILIYNPFLIMDVGLQLSYLGTLGIILFHKTIYEILRNIKIKNKKYKYKINRKLILIVDKIKEILAVTISAQLFIFPVMIYHFNMLGTYFILTNIFVSIIIGPIVIVGAFKIIFSFISLSFAKFISNILEILVFILLQIIKIGELPFSKIYLPTPSIGFILIYYICILIINYIWKAYNNKTPSTTELRVRNTIAVIKYKIKQNQKTFKKILIIMLIVVTTISIVNIKIKNLEVHFIDVGQGDCTFIVTPENKTILIDAGGSSSKKFDVGKSTVLPYILDKGYTKLNYVFISHFDQDHVGGILSILDEIKIEKIIIGKQKESSANYEEFVRKVKERKIEVVVAKKGDKLKIERNLYFDVLWPGKERVEENAINNNALVLKFNYYKFNMLLAGDIEKVAEEKILEEYKDKNILKSDILEIAHHGSKSSSTEEFLEAVKPEIALIGVGKNNLFNHPSKEIIERLKKRKIRIYRTDEDGEISFVVNKKGKIFKSNIQKENW